MPYIDKAKLMSHIERENREYGDEYDAYQILSDIEDFQTADVVPVVRCSDCKYFENVWCPLEWIPEEDWFCANGRRRENGRK